MNSRQNITRVPLFYPLTVHFKSYTEIFQLLGMGQESGFRVFGNITGF